MPIFKTPFSVTTKFVEPYDPTEHPLKELVSPLTPQQMLNRVANGQPICVHRYENNQLRLNGRFFNGDKLDVYDSILLEQKRLKSLGAVNPLSSTAPTDTNSAKQESEQSVES